MIVAALIATVAAAAPSGRPVDRYNVRWSVPAADTGHHVPVGRPTPPAGPYAGNGDVTVMYAANSSGGVKGTTLDWQQWLHLSKNDM